MAPDLLLATCAYFPEGEPGHEHLDRALAGRGIEARWARWDDDGVDWPSARLVAVRATWDYDTRLPEFLAWADGVGPGLLNGADVFAWNTDKAYLVEIAETGLPVVPTRVADGDLMRWEGDWVISELELTEPGLYLEELPGNAGAFAAVVAGRLGDEVVRSFALDHPEC